MRLNGGFTTRLVSDTVSGNENAKGWLPLIARVKKTARVKKIQLQRLGSIWPFAVPTGLTILPSLEAARLYPWWTAILVFNAVWITLRLSDHWACTNRFGFVRRALMATSIVILAETMVLSTTIEVCSSDQAGCQRVLKPVRSAATWVAQALPNR